MGIEEAFPKALVAALEGLGLTVYDFAPQDADGERTAPFPYVETGDIKPDQWDTKTELGYEIRFEIHTRGRSGSRRQVLAIQTQIRERLHLGELEIEDHYLVLMERESTICGRATDQSIHGVCDYRALIAAN